MKLSLSTFCVIFGPIISCLVSVLASPDLQSRQQALFVQGEQEPSPGHLSDVISSSPLLSFHRSICEIESITNNELAVAEYLIKYFEAHNFTVTPQKVAQPESSDSEKDRYNIIAFPKSSGDTSTTRKGPRVLLSSHIDTVPPFIPYSLSYPSDSETSSTSFNRSAVVISGRGTVDAKACVVTQIHATLSLLSTSSISPSDVGLVFVVGEEYGGDGMLHFSASSLHKDLAQDYETVIFGEPTDLRLASGHKGILLAKITARGKAAHSGYPWLGRSANSMIIPALMVLDKLGDIPEEKGGLPRSEKYGNTTVNVGLIRGGVAGNVIPEHAYAEVISRLAGGNRVNAVAIIKNAVKSVDERLDIEFSNGYGPVDIDSDVKGFGEPITVNYGTDIPNLKVKKGVKRYLYGPGSILVAHSDHEALTVGDLEEAVEGYKRLVLQALGK